VPRDERFDRTGQVHGHERYCRAGRARPPEGDSRHSDRTVRRRDSRPTAGPHRRARAHAGRERDAIRDATFVTGMSLEVDLLDAAENLSVFACAYAGTGHLPRETRGTRRRGDERFGRPRAEHRRARAGSILHFTRRFHVGARRQRRRASGDITGRANCRDRRSPSSDWARSDGRSVTGSSRSASRRSAFATRPRRAARPTR